MSIPYHAYFGIADQAKPNITESVALATRSPAEFLGLGHELGRIAPGYRASLALVDDDLQVLAVPLLGGHLDGLLIADGARGDGGLDTAAGDGFAIDLALA